MTSYVDIETRARLDLKRVSVHRYVECPDFEILTMAWAVDDSPVLTAVGHAAISDVLADLQDPLVAHNAQFERTCLGTLLPELQDPCRWIDTQALAGEYGLPQGLDGAARALGVDQQKDEDGKRLIRLFCQPQRNGEFVDPTDHPADWLMFLEYCEQDTETLRAIHRALPDFPTETERRLWQVDQIINDRGIPLDRPLAEAATGAVEANKASQMEELRELTGCANPNSRQQFLAWAQEAGVPMKNTQAKTVERLLESPLLHHEHAYVLETKRELSLASGAKYATALELANEDDRVRGGFQFFGAHTGRWAGRGVQLQNLPRDAFEDEREIDSACLDLKLTGESDPMTLKKLVRSMFTGPFTVVDYAAIEARVLAWLAGERWAIEAFAEGRDIYVETAKRMSTPNNQLTRFQGKVAVLALGYNGGVNSLRVMGATGTDRELRALVTQWRKANRRIVNFWGELGDAVNEGGRAGKLVKVRRHGDRMEIRLPSGRSIWYHGVKWEKFVIVEEYEDTDEDGNIVVKERRKRKRGWRYSDPKAPARRIGTYGGRLAENVTQAVARDLLAEALIRLEERGYRVVAHIHDEVVVEGAHPVEEIAAIMSEAPKWARGLPIDAEGFQCRRFRKG